MACRRKGDPRTGQNRAIGQFRSKVDVNQGCRPGTRIAFQATSWYCSAENARLYIDLPSNPVDGGFTMRCRACAHENEAASRFCVACGVSLAPVCAHCGRDFPETSQSAPGAASRGRPMPMWPRRRANASKRPFCLPSHRFNRADRRPGRRSGDELPASDRDGHGARGAPL